MAKGNLILGTMSGKLGDVVAYNYNGKQAARVRRRTIANPKSAKQAIQRAIAASVAKFVSAFAPVLNNSLQSEQTKVKTLAKIRSLNMNFLRQLAAQELGTYCPKGSIFVAPNDYIISRGSLRGIEPLRSDSALSEMRRTISGLFNATDIVVNATNTASQAFPGIAAGDQITIIATSHTAIADGSQVAMCRFAFKDDTTPVFLATEDVGEFILNPAAIDLSKADGKYDELVFETATLDGSAISRIHVGNLLGGVVFLDNFGLIVSREEKKLRSNARMVSIPYADFSLDEVYPTYMDGGTAIDMPSENYLDNDAVVVVPPFLELLNPDGTAAVMPLTRQVSTTNASMFRFNQSPATRFNLVINFEINGTSYTAQIDQASSTSVGGVSWEYASGNNVIAASSGSGELTITKVRYRDNEGHDITWD